jgi:hypothetical protein
METMMLIMNFFLLIVGKLLDLFILVFYLVTRVVLAILHAEIVYMLFMPVCPVAVKILELLLLF